MKLYKYTSVRDLWRVVDLVLNQRVYCAHWMDLNDPFEGRYELALPAAFHDLTRDQSRHLWERRDKLRIASFSADPENYLLWSHYADGAKGIAIEVDIPEDFEGLHRVIYTPFSSVFTEPVSDEADIRHIFNGKTEEWSYEEEYRLIVESEYCALPNPIRLIYVGPRLPHEKEKLLRAVLPSEVHLQKMHLNRTQGRIEPNPRDDWGDCE